MCLVLWLGFALVFPLGLEAQEPSDQAAGAPTPTGPLTTVHGVVRNAVSDEPLARALVRIDGDASTGVLTDGDGRFEIPEVPVGPQEFEVIKPGFLDETAEVAAGGMWENSGAYAHNVMVAAEMPDVVFTMSPTNAIRGQAQLSTGDPAEGIGVVLLRRAVENGRLVWQVASTTKTNGEGAYRFGGLADGFYAIYSDPAMDSEPASNLIAPGSAADVPRSGYASQFYPEARDLAGAARIHLEGGETAEANLSLTLEPFHAVTATVLAPGTRQSREGGLNGAAQILDAQGHQLPYAAQYDPATHTAQTLLPDGSYTMVINVAGPSRPRLTGTGVSAGSGDNSFVGSVDFSVSGHAVPNLRVSLSPVRNSPIEVNLVRTGTLAGQSGPGQEGIFISVSRAGGWISDGIVGAFAEGSLAGPLNSTYTPPGSYWAHTTIADKRICEASLTAGGANLAREPLVVGPVGNVPPVSLTLRDDCASLTLNLPAGLAVPIAGEEPFYTVYAVPDFDTTVDLVPLTLRASTGGTYTLTGLTPGNYHVYTFDKPVALAYRNAATLSGIHSQAVTVQPGGQSELVLEVPGP